MAYSTGGIPAKGGYFLGTTAGVEASSDGGYGVYGMSDEAAKAGVFGRHNGSTCTGGTGEFTLEQYCYGVAGVSYTSSTHGIGVYGYGSNTGVWGVAHTSANWSGYFSVGKVGLGAGVTVVNASDRNLKRDISPLSANLDALLRLKPSSYAWKSDPDDTHRSYGFIAQDVQDVLPELVSHTMEGDLALDYTGFIPVIVGGVQELEARVATIESGSQPVSRAAPSASSGTTTIATSTLALLLVGGMSGAAAMGGVMGAVVTRRRR